MNGHNRSISEIGTKNHINKKNKLIEWGERHLLIDGRKFTLRFIPLQIIESQPGLLLLIQNIVKDLGRGLD